MLTYVIKRDGQVVFCDGQKISQAIAKAALAANETLDSNRLAQAVLQQAALLEVERVGVETIQDIVEQQLMQSGASATAKAYILYREERRKVREGRILIDATQKLFRNYLDDTDWLVKENANTRKSVNGMNNYIRESFTKQYWLHEVYPVEIRDAHLRGALHIHDLGFFGPYCCGWDLQQLLLMGFGGITGKVSSKPAKHLPSLLGQIVNATFTTQGESAGAQAWSSIDTYCAPFIRYDALDYRAVKQAVQEFVFNLNVPTRVGFQCPFSNLTFDLTVPQRMRNQGVIIGGKVLDATYGDFQAEMDIFNLAFCEVMMEGDASGRVFTFPIPTINVTKEFSWEGPVADAIMEMTCKYGIPYFSNYVNSDLSPEDALSMCCRLRLDTTELRKRGGGLFGSNPLTGSIGVVTLNLPRLAYEAQDEDDFQTRLVALVNVAVTSLELKRKIVEQETERGMYPFSARWLAEIKEREGSYWANHFSTVGLVGMEEAALNLFGSDGSLTTQFGQDFALRTLNLLREKIVEHQKETKHFYNLEATPAEGTSYRLAKLDRQDYPNIITAGIEVPYYTNSSQLPVGYTDDLFETLDLQDDLQCQYTGGTVLHLYLGERIKDTSVAKTLLRNIFSHYKLPYVSLTPTFSTCDEHGYLTGEVAVCPLCGRETEVWTRVVGYLRPVRDFHPGKREEHRLRTSYVMPKISSHQLAL
ncbi:MAG: ribonucleoside triphosphate reductase [Sphaerochaetaceae bacterium]|jgi:ribonucleoside-triphosphate reductase|nr:ribonucleoside triphosphate reductase [Sphaerochaetaceae bacterium]MDD4220044.1 ribonucleoside triphosphate reductase [Sphaerochaetaceae bacterium]MDY0370808.1 ribonucleoside triphosphate reductase [Sphaerochaetaceae bacterium]